MSRRIAAVDVGSNTVHLLVAEVDGGPPREVLRIVSMPRLGRAVEATGAIGAAHLATAVAELRRLTGAAREQGAETVLLGATEAVRRAADRDEALQAFGEAAGTPCRLIAPEAEARLAFRGATSAHPAAGPVLVADVGGASTECVLGLRGRVLELASVRLGSGLATDRWLHSDPPTEAELRDCAAGVRALLDGAPSGMVEQGIVTGGTATTLPRLLERDGMDALDGVDLAECRRRAAAAPSEEVAARYGVDPARARVLAAGAEIVVALMERYALDRVTPSVEGLRTGMILAFLERGDAWVDG